MTDGLKKNPNQKQGFFPARSTYSYFPTRLWAETPHWISFVLLYCYYHSLISKRICVVDPLSGAFNVSWLTWIYQRWNVIVVMMLAAKQPSLAWVKGNTCLGRKNIGEHSFPSWGHRFSFWNFIFKMPQNNQIKPCTSTFFWSRTKTPTASGQNPHDALKKIRAHILLQLFKVHRSYQVSHKPAANQSVPLNPRWMCKMC